jgi:hypothetical protein
LVKALEIFSSSNYRNEAGNLKETATAGALIAFWGAVGFAIWLGAQGGAFPSKDTSDPSSDELSAAITRQCIDLAKTPEAAAECVK